MHQMNLPEEGISSSRYLSQESLPTSIQIRKVRSAAVSTVGLTFKKNAFMTVVAQSYGVFMTADLIFHHHKGCGNTINGCVVGFGCMSIWFHVVQLAVHFKPHYPQSCAKPGILTPYINYLLLLFKPIS